MTIIMLEKVLFFPINAPVQFDTVEDLAGLNLGTGLGYKYHTIGSYFADKRITRTDTVSVYARLVMAWSRRTDAALEEKVVGLWGIKQEPQLHGKLAFSKNIIGKAVGYRFRFTKAHNWQPFVTQFNEALASMKKDGTLNKIISRYTQTK